MPRPIAYLITFSTHASHLHGDPRGSVDRQHNQRGRPFERTSPELMATERRLSAPVTLSLDQRCSIEATIRSVCEFRGWALIAVSARTQHVHVAVAAPKHDADAVATTLKAWTTRRLREQGLWPEAALLWTRGESKRNLWTLASVAHARWYVNERQEEAR
jgi:REP element-mobilizing transposase RayT